ncbi:MAG: (2Fe-2S)-binding protein [Alphaproteobacteria bacterium]|nr:(2Fe-2S)-binding protein [Alphaproteobacteria bacterium]
MFRRLHEPDGQSVSIDFEGEIINVAAGETVAAAVLAAGAEHSRTTPVTGATRLPFCMMGACFDCLMEIDGIPNRQACMVRVENGMKVRRQEGKRRLEA